MTSPRIIAARRGPVLASATAAVTLTLAAGLSGCALTDEFGSHQKERVFATAADVSSEADPAFVPPSFVPEDATDLKIRVITNGPGDILRYTSATAIDDEYCAPGTLVGSPLLESTWWPAEVPTEGIVCGSGWQVFDKDGNTYAWASV
ncbi:hypothetical protein B0I08_106242 [Glaciihabitans tibetensis]|uniref:Lipoprotein with Yx(FWY)xxD motif n=1 Tax=Glaciihabitans tibetensis TaxID=1266600 RepID=A0A2T0VBS4_9MICO|nr:hypothetical protein [Glaciihabitans tibetensis]PRY67635.1 hypothetical protein B0I08_106242 [Glaciihabitans tibetensis]